MTCLHYAAERGKLDVVEYLIEKGADFRVADKSGQTPLHSAAERRQLGVVKYLILGLVIRVAKLLYTVLPKQAN